MMTRAGFDDHFKRKFYCEVVSTAMKLDNMTVRHRVGKPPYYMLFKEHPKYRKHPRSLEKELWLPIMKEN